MPCCDSLISVTTMVVPYERTWIQILHHISYHRDVTAKHFAAKLSKFELDLSNQKEMITPITYHIFVFLWQERLVPGFFMEIVVEFTSSEWRYYYDCIRIHCQVRTSKNKKYLMELYFPRKTIEQTESKTSMQYCVIRGFNTVYQKNVGQLLRIWKFRYLNDNWFWMSIYWF